MNIIAIDHLVLTTPDIRRTVQFYREVLGMEEEVFGENRTALRFGSQKINLHELGKEISPHALSPTAGALDLCLMTELEMSEVLSSLANAGVEIELGPVMRTGARGAIRSVYIRDPDGNLIEISTYDL